MIRRRISIRSKTKSSCVGACLRSVTEANLWSSKTPYRQIWWAKRWSPASRQCRSRWCRRRIASANRCPARSSSSAVFLTAQPASYGKSRVADGSGLMCDLGTGLAWRSFNCRGSGRPASLPLPAAVNARANRSRTAIAAWIAASRSTITTTTLSIRRRAMSRRKLSGNWWGTRLLNVKRLLIYTSKRAYSLRSLAVATGSGATSMNRMGDGKCYRPMRIIGGSSCLQRSLAADRLRLSSCFIAVGAGARFR